MGWTTTLEGVVFVVATVTCAVSAWSLWQSHRDHRLLRRLRLNGVRRLTLGARLVRDVSRVTCATVLMVASAVALWYPADYDTVAVTLKIAVLIIALLLGLAVYGDLHWRLSIDAAIDDLERKAHR